MPALSSVRCLLLLALSVGSGTLAHGQSGSGPLPAQPQRWVILDPSGQSRPVILVVDGAAYNLATTPIVNGDTPPPPPGGDPIPPPPDDVPDTLGFLAIAKEAAESAGLTSDEREALAKAYDESAKLAGQFGTLNEMANASNALVTAAGEVARFRPIFDAVHAHLLLAWGTKINSQDLLAQAYREVAAGLRRVAK